MIQDTALFMFGIQGKTLNQNEVNWLNHPLTAGVILFTRNYESPQQLTEFIQTIRQTSAHDLLIAVDHEGGRVQRFKNGFTHLPAMAEFGKIYDTNPALACSLCYDAGLVMAYEIAQCDIDFSFAPVLDMQNKISQIIGDRAFHKQTTILSTLANKFYQGMREAGTIGVGKHFPGHGNVEADSHLELPECHRLLDDLQQSDILPFAKLIDNGIEAIMPAHILFTAVDGMPAGFSNFWLQHILRQQLGFDGCIISDDLDMAGAAVFGGIDERIQLAQQNCDLILLCNDHQHMQQAFENTQYDNNSVRQSRLTKLIKSSTKASINDYKKAKQNLQTASLIN